MMCTVSGCKNSSKGNNKWNFFSFPKDTETCEKWIKFCRRNGQINVKNARICNIHFKSDDFESDLQYDLGFSLRRKLKRDAYPTLRSEDTDTEADVDVEELGICDESIVKIEEEEEEEEAGNYSDVSHSKRKTVQINESIKKIRLDIDMTTQHDTNAQAAIFSNQTHSSVIVQNEAFTDTYHEFIEPDLSLVKIEEEQFLDISETACIEPDLNLIKTEPESLETVCLQPDYHIVKSETASLLADPLSISQTDSESLLTDPLSTSQVNSEIAFLTLKREHIDKESLPVDELNDKQSEIRVKRAPKKINIKQKTIAANKKIKIETKYSIIEFINFYKKLIPLINTKSFDIRVAHKQLGKILRTTNPTASVVQVELFIKTLNEAYEEYRQHYNEFKTDSDKIMNPEMSQAQYLDYVISELRANAENKLKAKLEILASQPTEDLNNFDCIFHESNKDILSEFIDCFKEHASLLENSKHKKKSVYLKLLKIVQKIKPKADMNDVSSYVDRLMNTYNESITKSVTTTGESVPWWLNTFSVPSTTNKIDQAINESQTYLQKVIRIETKQVLIEFINFYKVLLPMWPTEQIEKIKAYKQLHKIINTGNRAVNISHVKLLIKTLNYAYEKYCQRNRKMRENGRQIVKSEMTETEYLTHIVNELRSNVKCTLKTKLESIIAEPMQENTKKYSYQLKLSFLNDCVYEYICRMRCHKPKVWITDEDIFNKAIKFRDLITDFKRYLPNNEWLQKFKANYNLKSYMDLTFENVKYKPRNISRGLKDIICYCSQYPKPNYAEMERIAEFHRQVLHHYLLRMYHEHDDAWPSKESTLNIAKRLCVLLDIDDVMITQLWLNNFCDEFNVLSGNKSVNVYPSIDELQQAIAACKKLQNSKQQQIKNTKTRAESLECLNEYVYGYIQRMRCFEPNTVLTDEHVIEHAFKCRNYIDNFKDFLPDIEWLSNFKKIYKIQSFMDLEVTKAQVEEFGKSCLMNDTMIYYYQYPKKNTMDIKRRVALHKKAVYAYLMYAKQQTCGGFPSKESTSHESNRIRILLEIEDVVVTDKSIYDICIEYDIVLQSSYLRVHPTIAELQAIIDSCKDEEYQENAIAINQKNV